MVTANRSQTKVSDLRLTSGSKSVGLGEIAPPIDSFLLSSAYGSLSPLSQNDPSVEPSTMTAANAISAPTILTTTISR